MQIIHTYRNHVLGCTRWQGYAPRNDDIIVATANKSGATWTLEIVRQLIFLDQVVLLLQEIWVDQYF